MSLPPTRRRPPAPVGRPTLRPTVGPAAATGGAPRAGLTGPPRRCADGHARNGVTFAPCGPSASLPQGATDVGVPDPTGECRIVRSGRRRGNGPAQCGPHTHAAGAARCVRAPHRQRRVRARSAQWDRPGQGDRSVTSGGRVAAFVPLESRSMWATSREGSPPDRPAARGLAPSDWSRPSGVGSPPAPGVRAPGVAPPDGRRDARALVTMLAVPARPLAPASQDDAERKCCPC